MDPRAGLRVALERPGKRIVRPQLENASGVSLWIGNPCPSALPNLFTLSPGGA
jgi:hypothetical protein